MKATVQFNLRLTEKELETIKAAAKSAETSTNRYFIDCALKGLKSAHKQPKQDPQEKPVKSVATIKKREKVKPGATFKPYTKGEAAK